jgi:methionyl-tRNA formyltransferase
MKVLFLGTSDFAVPTLEALAASDKHSVLAVVTQPDKPQGRGLHLVESPVKKVAGRMGLHVLQPRRVRAESFLESAIIMAPDVLVLAAFGQIIPQFLLDLPPFGPVNVHGSLLPAYRGAAPIQRAILNGEKVTGITTMWMDATLDTGDILLQRSLPIKEEDTSGTLIPKMAELGAELLMETLDRLSAGTCPRVPQDHSKATFAPAITSEDSVIPWTDSADAICNRIRAMSPRPGAFTTFKGRRVKVWLAGTKSGYGETGAVTAVTKEGIAVATRNGTVQLLEVQAENAKRMNATEWARGARVVIGERFE